MPGHHRKRRQNLSTKKTLPNNSGQSKKAQEHIDRTMDLQAVAESTGFSERHLRNFIQRGMPCGRIQGSHGGKAAIKLSLAEVVEWCSDNNIVTPSGRGNAAEQLARANADILDQEKKEQSEPGPDRKKAAQQVDLVKLSQLGIVGALERLRLAEYNSSHLILSRLKQGASRDEINALEKLHSRIAANMRITEFAVLKYRQEHGELVRFGEMVTAWERVATGFKNAVLGLPSSIVPRVLHLLKNEDDCMHELERILDEECRRALISLPNEVPTGSNTTGSGGGDSASTA